MDSITYSDYYLLANDFADYVATQDRVDQASRRMPPGGPAHGGRTPGVAATQGRLLAL